MNTEDFYKTILGLDNEWQVADVAMDISGGNVFIKLDFCGQSRCPECDTVCACHDHAPTRRWRHLDTCQLETIIEASVPRVECPLHGIRTMHVPWSKPNSRFTILFESLVIEWLKLTKCQKSVSTQLNISSDQVNGIMSRAVSRGLERKKDAPVAQIGIDEKSMKRGHHYMTIVSDLSSGIVLSVVEDRTNDSAIKALEEAIPEVHRGEVKAVCADMWPPYATASSEILKNADLVHDRFHVTFHLNKAIDATRRKETRNITGDDKEDMKFSRWVFLKNYENLSDSQVLKFEEAQSVAINTAIVWRHRETFRIFWNHISEKSAQEYLDNWYESAISASIDPLTKVADMIKNHAAGLLAYIRHRITNAVAENLNGRIQHLKSTARGFRNFKVYKVNILFHFGGLDLSH